MSTASYVLIRVAAALSVGAVGVSGRALDAEPVQSDLFMRRAEIHVVTPDHNGLVPLAVGHRYNILPFSEEVLLRDCQFTPAMLGIENPINVYVAGPTIGIDGADLSNLGAYNCVGRTRHGTVERTIYLVPLERNDEVFV